MDEDEVMSDERDERQTSAELDDSAPEAIASQPNEGADEADVPIASEVPPMEVGAELTDANLTAQPVASQPDADIVEGTVEIIAGEADEDAGRDDEDDEDEETEVVIFDADAEDAEEAAHHAAQAAALLAPTAEVVAENDDGEIAPGGAARDMAGMMSIIEALVFVSEEPLTAKSLADILQEDRGWVDVALGELEKEFNERNGGLMLREVAGGWQFATRPEHHEHVRLFLKSRPSAKLSLAALETLAVIAYKQPITVPEILEIRGVQSSSAIKTLLDKRLIISKGRKETVGRPMLYGTSKEFLMQFGLKDLNELPNVEDFEDLAAGGA